MKDKTFEKVVFGVICGVILVLILVQVTSRPSPQDNSNCVYSITNGSC